MESTNMFFVTKLNNSGSALLYSTYLGGTDNETAVGIAVDSEMNVYLTGETGSPDFPTVNPTQSAKAGSLDAFVHKNKFLRLLSGFFYVPWRQRF